MRADQVGNGDKKRSGRNGLFAGFGARIARSLFFWGLAAILASSAYTGIVKNNSAVGAGEKIPAAVQMNGKKARTSEKGISKTGSNNASETESNGVSETEPGDTAEQKRVALTFDDGPHPFYTEELLDGLKERGAKATFFVIGKNIPGNEDVIRRMDEEGHLIGNHTYDHARISKMDRTAACEQIEKTSALVRELTGKDTEFVRPPFGEWKKDLECSFVMIPVLWDVDPKDWTTKNVSDIVRRVLEDVQDGDIILLHDYYKSSVEAALQIVDALQGKGYEFVTVDELILE